MSIRRVTFTDIAAVLGLGILCLPILHFMPTVEQSRNEARVAMAYIVVHNYKDPSQAEEQYGPLAHRDPWGTPYRRVPLPDGSIRVLSCGPNQVSPTETPDGDDIYSDMPTNPTKDSATRKGRQFLLVCGTMLAVWLLLSVIYLQSRRRES